MKKLLTLILFLLIIAISLTGCDLSSYLPDEIPGITDGKKPDTDTDLPPISLDEIPEFDGSAPYVVINGNLPYFTEDEMKTKSYESYAELDALGRCGVTVACVGKDIMPTDERGSIGVVKPSGWHTVKYDIVSGKYLYNRCHLIGYQLTGENANEKNLITGTRYMNVDGMLPFEDMVADYVKETSNHVMYRVTPIFKGENLVAHGALMEAKSVEDNGDGIEFCVYVYNNQPGIIIDYKTGESHLDNGSYTPPKEDGDSKPEGETGSDKAEENTYVINTDTMKFHKESCHYAKNMNEANKDIFVGTKEELLDAGYDDCGTCKP